MAEKAWYSLSQLSGLIRAEIEDWSSRTGDVLVVAEVAEIRQSPGGHWFLGLVERRDAGVVAEMRAVIWARQASALTRFRQTTGTAVAAGMELLMRGRVGYHERYGLRFDIIDIDPSYSLGEMQRKRREVIERLQREGLLERNKGVVFVRVPQRIAVVSSEGAAGYGDFVRELHDNPYAYTFHLQLFSALMQGDGAEASVSGALARITEAAGSFDVVVVIRGGGSQVDLSCFDTYGIAAAIARCPLPVIAGLGHERDESVADMVAHTRVKTPTAAAATIVGRVRTFEERMEELWGQIAMQVRQQMEALRSRHALTTSRFGMAVSDAIKQERTRVEGVARRMTGGTPRVLRANEGRLATVAQSLWKVGMAGLRRDHGRMTALVTGLRLHGRVALQSADLKVTGIQRELVHLDPAAILKRGFSITRYQGKALVSDEGLLLGDELETLLADGRIMSCVIGVGGGNEKK